MPRDGPGMSRREREEHLQEGLSSRSYQSHDRYHRSRTPRTPKTPQTTVSEEEERELLSLGRALSCEQEDSPTYFSVASSMHHPQVQTPSRHFTGMGTHTMYDGRQVASDAALAPQASSWAARSRTPHDTFQQQTRGLEATPARSNDNQPSNLGDGQSYLHGFSVSPSHSTYEEKPPDNMNVKGLNYSHPKSIPRGAQSEQLSQNSVHSQDRHFNKQTASPFAFGQQSSNHTYSRANLEEPSIMHEQQGSVFTPSLSSTRDPRPFGEGSHSPRAFPSLTNVLGHQENESTEFRSHQEGVSQTGRDFNGYSPTVGPSNTRRGFFNETASPLEYKSQATNFSGHQMGSYQTTKVNQSTEYPRFGTNRFANLQDVVENPGQVSPTSSHRSSPSGYKPAHVRYGHDHCPDQFQTSEQREIPVSSTHLYPPEVGQSFQASGPRDYAALLATSHRQLEYGHRFEAPTSLQSSELEYRDQRSKSARGHYSPSSYGERPLPPLPRKTGRERNLGLAVREAQEESALEDENRDKMCDERGEYVKELRAGQVKKAKSINNMANRSGTPTIYQPRSYTPDASFGRLPPQVPPPPATRPTTAFNHLINKVSVGSGSDCLARISEVAASTSSIIKEFMAQNMVERFVKSFSRSNERGILAGLKELNSKIDWLGDSLWKGSEDARRLFANQHNETITLIYNRVSSLCKSYMALANDCLR